MQSAYKGTLEQWMDFLVWGMAWAEKSVIIPQKNKTQGLCIVIPKSFWVYFIVHKMK